MFQRHTSSIKVIAHMVDGRLGISPAQKNGAQERTIAVRDLSWAERSACRTHFVAADENVLTRLLVHGHRIGARRQRRAGENACARAGWQSGRAWGRTGRYTLHDR